jgi:hypothetical protein
MAVMGQRERRNWDFGDALGEDGCGVAEMDIVKERKAGEAVETAWRNVVEANDRWKGYKCGSVPCNSNNNSNRT